MKFVKRITALFLALTMVMAMGITAFAADTTYTITGPGNGHTYKVYQIFTGDYDATSGKLSNIKWGANGTGTEGNKVSDDDLKAITDLAGKSESEIASGVKAKWNSQSAAVATIDDTNKTYTAVGGYYILVDETDEDAVSIVKVVANVTVKPKTSDTPGFEKKIKDTNDTTGVTSDWQDSADYDIGDEVPFKLTATLPDDYASYEKYFLQFTDQMEPSLTFNENSVVVKIDGVAVEKGDDTWSITKGTTSSSDTYNKGDNFVIKFADLKKTAAKAKGTVTVEFTAKLNEKAVLGSTGNVNEAKLKYSNNPSNSGNGESGPTDETPWDTVICFTYKVIVDKYADKTSAQGGTKLPGAEFTLSKKLSDGTTKAIEVVKSDEGKTFTFSGLDDGDYVLTETKTPAGYNTIAPITFTISATHSETWDGTNRTEVLTALTGAKETGATYEFTMTPDVTAGSLSAEVVNKSGSTLPTTGGMGTTVLYVAGIALIVVAGVVVIARKRNA